MVSIHQGVAILHSSFNRRGSTIPADLTIKLGRSGSQISKETNMTDESDFEPEEIDHDKRAQDEKKPIDEIKTPFQKALEKYRLKRKV
jgi:hypothetical protein